MSFVQVVSLHTNPEAAGTLQRWYCEQWPKWYEPPGPGNAHYDLAECLTDPDVLPSCLIAQDASGQAIGTVCLRQTSPGSDRHPGAWLTALLVVAKHRNAGVGSALVAAAEAEARRLGFKRLHASTSTAASLLGRRAWREIDEIDSSGDQLKIFCKSL